MTMPLLLLLPPLLLLSLRLRSLSLLHPPVDRRPHHLQ